MRSFLASLAPRPTRPASQTQVRRAHAVTRWSGACALLIALSLIALCTAGPAAFGQTCDFTPVHQVAQGIVDAAPLVTGASVWIETGDLSVSETTHLGTFDDTTVVPVASASKLLSAVAILSLVDDGLLDLDAPLSSYLPEWTGPAGTMTVRQMFSHTSGLPGGSDHSVLSDDTLTLAQAAEVIRTTIPLEAPPGSLFAYGGLSMHVAGRVAEVVSGQTWSQLFAERVSTPLGLTTVDFFGFGFTQNPRVAGGARASLADYAKVLAMIRDRGFGNGVQVLSPAAVATMVSDQTAGATIVSTPAPPGTRYGVGVWLDEVSPTGEALRISSPGAFGFTPWIDLDLRLSAIFMVFFSYTEVRDDTYLMQDLAHAEVVACRPFFLRGDVNGDFTRDIGDPIALLGELFATGGQTPVVSCADALDANGDGAIDIADAVRLLNSLFGLGPNVIPFPGSTCGIDGAPDGLDCAISTCP